MRTSLIPLCILVHSCSSPPQPLELPPVDLRIGYEQRPTVGAATTALAFTVEVIAVAAAPAGRSVQVQALVIESESGRPFRGASRLPADSRWLTGAHAAAWQATRPTLQPHEFQVRCSAEAVVAPGLAAVIVAGALPLPRVWIAAAGDQLCVRLETVSDEGSEFVELRTPLSDERALLFVPLAAPGLAGHAIGLRRNGDATADAVAAARAAAHREPPPTDGTPTAWRLAMAAIGAANRRAALLALTQPLDLSRIVDLLLIADERALITITNALRKIRPEGPDLPWRIECTVWVALMQRLEREDVTPAMQACMRRQFGVLAAEPAALRLLLETARDCPSLGAAVREENLLALRDRHPTRRVHGHGWLVSNGGAVPGYDPLAPAAQRRAALRAHEPTEPDTEAAR